MKSLTLVVLLAMASVAMAKTPAKRNVSNDGSLGPCALTAQHAIIAIAQLNHIDVTKPEEYSKLLVKLASGGDYDAGKVVSWKSEDERFSVTTNTGHAEKNSCYISDLKFNPQP